MDPFLLKVKEYGFAFRTLDTREKITLKKTPSPIKYLPLKRTFYDFLKMDYLLFIEDIAQFKKKTNQPDVFSIASTNLIQQMDISFSRVSDTVFFDKTALCQNNYQPIRDDIVTNRTLYDPIIKELEFKCLFTNKDFFFEMSQALLFDLSCKETFQSQALKARIFSDLLNAYTETLEPKDSL